MGGTAGSRRHGTGVWAGPPPCLRERAVKRRVLGTQRVKLELYDLLHTPFGVERWGMYPQKSLENRAFQGRAKAVYNRDSATDQLETLFGGLGVPPAAGGKHSPRTSSLPGFCENLMVFRGLPRASWKFFFCHIYPITINNHAITIRITIQPSRSVG